MSHAVSQLKATNTNFSTLKAFWFLIAIQGLLVGTASERSWADGAIARSGDIVEFSFNEANNEIAIAKARAACDQRKVATLPCDTVKTFRNVCVAVNGSFVGEGSTSAEAREDALRKCRFEYRRHSREMIDRWCNRQVLGEACDAHAIASSSQPQPPVLSAISNWQHATASSRRVALVIGNSSYQSVARLANPVRDANTIAGVFRRLGFADVKLHNDLSQQAMKRALIEFAERAQGADWAVVYYAGHGLEMDGQNYLIPVDARLRQDRHVRLEGVSLDDVLESAGGAKTLRLVILDACRDNPFLAQMARTVMTRSIGRGLGAVEPAAGVYVAYAARHGQVALDGAGENSPFVVALVKHLEEPNLDLSLLFRKVRDTVMAATQNAQQPYTYGSLPGIPLSFKPERR